MAGTNFDDLTGEQGRWQCFEALQRYVLVCFKRDIVIVAIHFL